MSKQSYAEIIRQAYAANPTLGGTDLARLIKKEQQIDIPIGTVHNQLSAIRRKGNKPAPKRGRPPIGAGKAVPQPAAAVSLGRDAAASVDLDALIRIKKAADEFGGIAVLRRSLSVLERLLA